MRYNDPAVSIGSKAKGYPCPKDGELLILLPRGAWCPLCHTVWREADEVGLDDLDELPGPEHPAHNPT